jgi:hypothetical protein
VGLTDVTVRFCVLEAEAATSTAAILAITGARSTYTMRNVAFAVRLHDELPRLRHAIETASNAGNARQQTRERDQTGRFPSRRLECGAVTMPSTTFSGIYFSTSRARERRSATTSSAAHQQQHGLRQHLRTSRASDLQQQGGSRASADG